MLSAVPDFFHFTDLVNWPSALRDLSPPARLAVIGDPIAHSKSPQMHNPALLACGIDAQYIRVLVPPGSVRRAFDAFASRGFIGINVTIPHKFEALESVDFVDDLARRLGAVNTVALREDGLHGFNTDGPGFLRSVREAFGADARDLRVLILGAGGGAGRAVAVQCAIAGCPRVVLVNRTGEKAAALASELSAADPAAGVSAVPWEEAALRAVMPEVDLIVNGTSLGMKPEDGPLLPPGCLDSRHRVFDMVYRAGGAPTALAREAAEAGAGHADGATLLLHQGALSFEHWFGRPAPLEEMRAGLQSALIP